MKTSSPFRLLLFRAFAAALVAGFALCGCGRDTGKPMESAKGRRAGADPLAIALASHAGDSPLDEQIRRCQEQVRMTGSPETVLEQLGWLFVAKARESFDAGFYRLAEQCALALETRKPGSPEGLLLRGHAFHSLHRFHEAEPLAQQLVEKRGLAFDHGLLGDILVDLGRVDEAARVYQTMLDLKPDPQGYARAAHIRWLKGDLSGALEAMRMAARGGSSRDPESAAWMHSQLARYLWQAGQADEGLGALRIALGFQARYAPALWLRGRMLLAEAKTEEAILSLRRAAELHPLPEHEWALAEALRGGRREEEARAVEARILTRGAATDPRTFSLYLATRQEQVGTAVRLARNELDERADVFTQDALAWALAAAGNLEEAQTHMRLALAEGTQDARLCFHATIIAARSGNMDEARDWLNRTAAFKPQLLPSELVQLQAAGSLISSSAPSRAAAPTAATLRRFPDVARTATEKGN